MAADSPQRQRRHATKVERLRSHEAECSKAATQRAESGGPPMEGDTMDASLGTGTEQKLSEILLDLAEPFIRSPRRTPNQRQAAIGLAASVWNAVVLDRKGGNTWQLLVDSFRRECEEEAPTILEMAGAMRDRKLARYPSDLRRILNWTVMERGDKLEVTVLTGSPGPEQSDPR